ncbi:MAG: RsmE family RNA methyltransferase [Christensenellales bacterium]|jgi:16S rRNA (uracil1498-N3)-methyltransferase
MELKRFFINTEDIRNGEITISGGEYRHIVNVLRYKKGFRLIACPSDGNDYLAEITEIGKDCVNARIISKELNQNTPDIIINLYAAMIKEENYAITVQKAVELGVNAITPVISSYVDEKNIRLDRLNKIAISACKQCGRAEIVEVKEPIPFIEAVKAVLSDELSVMAYEKEKVVYLKDLLADKVKSIGVIIGPEGGFTDKEYELAKAEGIKTFSLGRRILKAETAAISVLCAINYEFER